MMWSLSALDMERMFDRSWTASKGQELLSVLHPQFTSLANRRNLPDRLRPR